MASNIKNLFRFKKTMLICITKYEKIPLRCPMVQGHWNFRKAILKLFDPNWFVVIFWELIRQESRFEWDRWFSRLRRWHWHCVVRNVIGSNLDLYCSFESVFISPYPVEILDRRKNEIMMIRVKRTLTR